MPDPYASIAQADEALQARLAGILELRAADIQLSLEKISLICQTQFAAMASRNSKMVATAPFRGLSLFRWAATPHQGTTKKGIMAFKELTTTEVDELLTGERAMRIGFDANNERYLVPLGFIWHEGALYAMTTQGRKTRMAAANPKVSFQIDTSARTGLFSWHSLSGEGTFEVVTDSKELEAISPLLVSRFPDMPNWMQAEYAEKQEQGKVVFVRIRPTRMTGRKSEPA